MSLRRGFKASANRMAVRLRRGQGLSPEAPISLEIIAERLDIEIVPLSSFAVKNPTAVHQLTVTDSGAFSATTLKIDMDKRVIIHNDSHDRRRQRSNVSHELSHVLLGHPFTYPIDASGCRNHDHDIEDEATCLGAAILVSNEAALHIVRIGMESETACETYGVSLPLLRMRLNGSGAHIRAKRTYH
ncbi:MAG: ImmA/IrrE family metallo-endopeptidase [Silvibacterium sp.]